MNFQNFTGKNDVYQLRNLLGFSGNSIGDTVRKIDRVLTQIEEETCRESARWNRKIPREIKALRKNLSATLKFLNRFFDLLRDEAKKSGLSYDFLCRVYGLRACGRKWSQKYTREWKYCFMLSGYSQENMKKALEIVDRLVHSVGRASSAVENLNSRVRVYMNAKRTVPGRFFSLVTLYLNTRHATRSRIIDRIGSSPMERLLGKQHIDFFELLDIPPVTVI